ncbi:hypothetical protein RND81_12G018700 [Saponaria officinalis]|uniref:CBM20 domain-containing protein n=1 Tax=Saponaria officinalis TaxID=3572 RepID=A0AAW1H605_SAPOF
MVNLDLINGGNAMKSVTITFRIPYFTQWGQSLLVRGSVPLLGLWNVKRGFLLTPVNHGSELIWRGSVEIPTSFECEYSYYVVDDGKKGLRCEMGRKRKLLLPDSVQDGDTVVELHDLWQVKIDVAPLSIIASLFLKSVFVKLVEVYT